MSTPQGGVFGLGIDVVETSRIASLLSGDKNDAFRDRVFTPQEIKWCDQHKNPIIHYAARFAAKEAASKAMGTGISSGISWLDLEVTREEDQAPKLVLHAGAKDMATKLGITHILLSLTHTDSYAAASAVAMGTIEKN